MISMNRIASAAIALSMMAGACLAQDGTWYSMNNAQGYEVAVGTRDQVWIINNNRDIYAWKWRTGSFQRENPAGGSWVMIPRMPGSRQALKIAGCENGLLYAVSTDNRIYRYNGVGWTDLTTLPGGDQGATNVTVRPDGLVMIFAAIGTGFKYLANDAWIRPARANSGIDLVPVYGIPNAPNYVLSVRYTDYQVQQYNGSFNPSEAPGIGAAYDLGGVYDRSSYQVYELWKLDPTYKKLYHCPYYDVWNPQLCVWVETNGNGIRVAAGQYNDVVVRISPARYIYISFDYYRS